MADTLPLQGVPDNSSAGRIAALESAIAALQRSLAAGRPQIGDYVYTSVVPPNWNTPSSLILVGNRMVPNGVNLVRADFPELNAAYAAMGYPYGSGDGSTTFGTKDVLARAVVCIGSSATTALNSDDGLPLASRVTVAVASPGSGTGRAPAALAVAGIWLLVVSP